MTQLQCWLKDVFGIDENTSATIIITIFVFGAGVGFSLLLDFFRAWYRRKMLQKVILMNIQDFIKGLTRQSKSYHSTALQFEMDSKTLLQTTRVELPQISIIKEIGYDETYQAFFYGFYNFNVCLRKLKRKSFQKIWETIQMVSFWQERALSDFDSFLSRYNTYNEMRNRAVSNLRDQLMALSNTQSTVIPKELFDAFNTVLLNWEKQEERTMPKIFHEKYTLPMLEICIKYSSIQQLNVIVSSLHEESWHYFNIVQLEQIKSKQFRHYGNLFKARAQLLKVVLKILK